jgi:hypothetical protein
MSPPFSASCMSVADLLGASHRLRVPGYQRGYAWTPDEAGHLLDDILLALESEPASGDPAHGDYFLGALVLMETTPAGAPYRALEIVDGLQRLLTITILLSVVRDLASASDDATAALAASAIGSEGGWRLEPAVEDREFLADFVQRPGASAAMPAEDPRDDPRGRILAVREHLAAALVAESTERLARLVHFLLSRCHCAVVVARTVDRAHQIFSILNDRGRPLERGDILKAELLAAVPAARRERDRERWAALEQQLGGSLEDLLSQIRGLEGRSRQGIVDDIRAMIVRAGGAAAFLDDVLYPYGSILVAVRSATYPPEPSQGPAAEVASRLVYLGWLGTWDWLPPVLLSWRRVEGDPARLAPFLARLDRLAYALRLLSVGADKRLRRYRIVLDEIRAGTIERRGSALDLTRDEQRQFFYHLRNLHERSQLACKLLLQRLNDELAGRPERLEGMQLTVEHVLPQKPPRGSQWREWFPGAEERERCTQSLGNLVLVPRDLNERARNLPFEQKLALFRAAEAGLPYITRDVLGHAVWRPAEVAAREERLAAALRRLWAFDAPAPRIPLAAPGDAPAGHEAAMTGALDRNTG